MTGCPWIHLLVKGTDNNQHEKVLCLKRGDVIMQVYKEQFDRNPLPLA